MKKIYTLQAFVALMLLLILPGAATAQHKFNKIKSFAARTAPIHEGYMDVIHLDSVISEQERVYYTYNEFGYLASQKTYRLEDGNIWTLQTDERDSFLSEYTFDEQNRCVDYSRYKYTPNETKGVKVEQITVAYFNDMRCEKYYYMDEEVSELALEEEITYDRFGNPTIMKEYTFDEETRTSRLYGYVEMRFTGCCISYDECENGNYELELDEDLFDEHCYYNVVWDADYNQLEGFKFERDENGNLVFYIIEESDFPESELGNIDNYWTIYDEEYEEEEYAKVQRVAKASIEDYEEGNHTIDFDDGDWYYHGEINVHIEEVDMGDTIIYEKFIDAHIFVTWQGNGIYRYTHPSYNYEFPIGIMCYRTSYDNVEDFPMGSNVVVWDNETKEWRFENHRADFTKHYEKNGKIIQEAARYTFNGETMRMEAIDGTLKTTIYSYDDAARLSTIEYPNYTTHFEYFGDTNYLQKEYTTDAQGRENTVCTYYYSIGKYLWPVTNATGIDEVATTGIAINGNSITADGKINVFTTSGSLVASGNGYVTINGKGLYIVEAGGKVHKILIK